MSARPVLRRAGGIVSRTMAAAAGGYALSYSATAALAVMLPLPKVDAAGVATLLAFAIHVGAVVWAFAAADQIRLWLGLILSTALLTAIGFWPLLSRALS